MQVLRALDMDETDGQIEDHQQGSPRMQPALGLTDDQRSAVVAEMSSLRHMVEQLQSSQRGSTEALHTAEDPERAALKAEIASMRDTIQQMQNLTRVDADIRPHESSAEAGGRPASPNSLLPPMLASGLTYATVELRKTSQEIAQRQPSQPRPGLDGKLHPVEQSLKSELPEQAQDSAQQAQMVAGRQDQRQAPRVQGGIIDDSTGDQIAPTKTSLGLGMLGTVVDTIVPRGPAEKSGTLVVGDCIIEVDGVTASEDNIGVLLVGDDIDKALVRITTRTPIGEIRCAFVMLALLLT